MAAAIGRNYQIDKLENGESTQINEKRGSKCYLEANEDSKQIIHANLKIAKEGGDEEEGNL